MRYPLNIFRGERRGWDELFFPHNPSLIDDVYIKKVVKNSRELQGYVSNPISYAFCCEKSVDELRQLNHTKTIDWIESFSNKTNNVGILLPDVLKRPNQHWYSLKPNTIADICNSINPSERLFFSYLSESSFVNQRLIGLSKKNDDVDVELCSALLNSILGLFYIESLGIGRGLGALDLNATNFKNNFHFLNPNLVSDEDRKIILDKYKLLQSRDVLVLSNELLMDD